LLGGIDEEIEGGIMFAGQDVQGRCLQTGQAITDPGQAGATLHRADVQTVKLGTTIGNIGLEGVSNDPSTTSGFPGAASLTNESPFDRNRSHESGSDAIVRSPGPRCSSHR